MLEISKQQRAMIVVLDAVPGELDELQCAMPGDAVQWHFITADDLISLKDHVQRIDCLLVRCSGDARELGNIATVREVSNALPIIAYGGPWQVSAVVQAMKLGATEVCETPANLSELRDALNRCLTTEARVRARYSDVIPRHLLAKLTSEEARILHLLVQGRTTKEVGATLDVSIRTVHYRKKELLRKLGVQNRSEAIELIRLNSGQLFNLAQGLEAWPI